MRRISFWAIVFVILISLRPIASTTVEAGVNDSTGCCTVNSVSDAGMKNMNLTSSIMSIKPTQVWEAVGIVISLISLGIQLWDIYQRHDAEGTDPWIDVKTPTIEDDGNGWQVGDRFYVSGDIDFDAGDHKGSVYLSCYLLIKVELYHEESGKIFLEDEVCKYFDGGGRGQASYE